jgi:6-phosphogluconolactonase
MSSMKQHLRISRTKEELDVAVAEEIIRSLTAVLDNREHAAIALSGGESPRSIYSLLGQSAFGTRVDWTRVHLFFSDERNVSPDDPQSNYGMVRHELIERISIPSVNVHRIKGELDPGVAAGEYSQLLEPWIGRGRTGFDLLLLGLGEDGHTASLFPGTDFLDDHDQLARSFFVQRLDSHRLSLSLKAINGSRKIIFVVSGMKKATILRDVSNSSQPNLAMPVTFVQPTDGIVQWMVDADAASMLSL